MNLKIGACVETWTSFGHEAADVLNFKISSKVVCFTVSEEGFRKANKYR